MSTSLYPDYRAALPLPDFLATEAQALSRLGAQQLRSSEVLSHPFLLPEHWLIAYVALITPHFSAEHVPILTSHQVVTEFQAKIRTPLQTGDIDSVDRYLHTLLNPSPAPDSPERPWSMASRTRKLPDGDHILGKTPFHLHNFNSDLAHFASLLAQAEDFLVSYNGKGVPGNVFLVDAAAAWLNNVVVRAVALLSAISDRRENVCDCELRLPPC